MNAAAYETAVDADDLADQFSAPAILFVLLAFAGPVLVRAIAAIGGAA